MKDLIKKSFLEESEVLLKSEMATLTGSDNLSDKTTVPADHPVVPGMCQTTCSNGCSTSCSSGCSKTRTS